MAEQFSQELHALRFGLKPSGVYLNPTERCNLNCTDRYLPDTQRSDGSLLTGGVEAAQDSAVFREVTRVMSSGSARAASARSATSALSTRSRSITPCA